MAKSRIIVFLLISAVYSSSCSQNSNGGSGPIVTTPSPTPTTATIGQAIVAASAAGALPVLNVDVSVLGVDADTNGIRDDIDSYIAGLPSSEIQKTALRQYARSLQASLVVNLNDAPSLATESQKISSGVQCVFSKFDAESAVSMAQDLEKYSINTKARFLAYAHYNDAVNGSVLLSREGTGCE